MLTVKFFSLIREALGTTELVLPAPAPGLTVAMLKTTLAAEHGEDWAAVLLAPNVVHAVNHRVVDPDAVLHDGDEVAFFPPMTGG